MILVALRIPFSDCYMQRVITQMGLLKSIKYSMFDVVVLNGIVDKRIRKMSILSSVLYEFWIDFEG